MRLPSGTVDQYVYFLALDATDLKTPETGLTGFTVYRGRNGAAAAAYTTPTVAEVDNVNMPGVYSLLVDEDMSIDAGDDSQEICLYITHGNMAPVVRVIELYRPKLTAGETLAVASGIGSANAVQISGDAVAADNLEAQFDGTGLTGDTYPSTQAQLGTLAIAGAASNTPADAYLLTTGVQSSGLYTDTLALNGTTHQHTDSAGAMDLYYEFNVGSGHPIDVHVTGALTGGNDTLGIYGYDWVSAQWVQIGSLAGKAASTNEVNVYQLFTTMAGTGANLGKVRVRFYAAAGLSTATLYVDQIFLAFSESQSGYENGSIWLDTNATNTGTKVGIDGVATNPVSVMTAVNSLMSQTNLNRVTVRQGSSVTFSQAQTTKYFMGEGWNLALGGQDISNSHFMEADVTGTGTSAGGPYDFHRCEIGTTTLGPGDFHDCEIYGGLTFGTTGNYHFYNCHSGIAGSGAPTVDLGAAVGGTNVMFRRWSGGLTLNNVQAGDTVSVDVVSGGTVTVNGTGGAVSIRGMCNVVDGSAGAVTITQTSVINQSVSMNVGKIDGSVAAAQNLAASAQGIIRGTAQTGSTTTVVGTNLSDSTDDVYIGRTIVFYSGAAAGEATVITDYNGTTFDLTVEALAQTPLNGDLFVIV